MQKLLLLTAFFLLFSSGVNASEADDPAKIFRFYYSSDVQRYFPEFLPSPAAFRMIEITPPLNEMYSVRGGNFDGPFAIHRYVIGYGTSVYHNFSMIRFQYPEANVFCRMENASCNRYGVMFSLHAGSVHY
jgi:hypothetical protein